MKKLESNKKKSILDEFPVWDEKRHKKLEKAIKSIIIKMPIKYDQPLGWS